MSTRLRVCSECGDPLDGQWPENLHIRIRWDLEEERKIVTWTCSDYEGPPP